jgi:hypothetical protein
MKEGVRIKVPPKKLAAVMVKYFAKELWERPRGDFDKHKPADGEPKCNSQKCLNTPIVVDCNTTVALDDADVRQCPKCTETK